MTRRAGWCENRVGSAALLFYVNPSINNLKTLSAIQHSIDEELFYHHPSALFPAHTVTIYPVS
jgi:hypothetical protein